MQFDDSRAESKPVRWRGKADTQRTQVRCHLRLGKPLQNEVESSLVRRVRRAPFSQAPFLGRVASMRHISKKARHDIGERHADEQPERSERAEERDTCSQRVDNEREGV